MNDLLVCIVCSYLARLSYVAIHPYKLHNTKQLPAWYVYNYSSPVTEIFVTYMTTMQ